MEDGNPMDFPASCFSSQDKSSNSFLEQGCIWPLHIEVIFHDSTLTALTSQTSRHLLASYNPPHQYGPIPL
ncbi:MAG: hypothetical protein OJF51_002889 [Nitrospira sp.]|jgi:hypothetical protein|nr:MAG: hypothetical protein OJF51_002889 [Nitrospira sp.]